ncbi:hypothetical protein RUND412_010066 [Rhizina undulata]
MPSHDYYEALGILPTASSDEIKNAYRRISLQCHPDKDLGNEDATQNFQKIQEAYDILSDPAKRAEYDGDPRVCPGKESWIYPDPAFWAERARRQAEELEAERRADEIRDAQRKEAEEILEAARKGLEAEREIKAEREKLEQERQEELRLLLAERVKIELERIAQLCKDAERFRTP